MRSPLDIRDKASSAHLDMIRGVAAIVVLIFHVRYRFFCDFSEIQNPTLVDSCFYVATSFGHDAVIVFFVLSGFFITSSVVRENIQLTFSWRKYFVNRLVRLYVVLIPGLLLTLVWDNIGLQLFGSHPIYSGVPQVWKNDYFPITDRLDAVTLVGNLGFLQTILVKPFGSNEALWSLAYEFWYYLLFPMFYIGILGKGSPVTRISLVVVGLVTLLAVGRGIAFYFPIWLLGSVLCFTREMTMFQNRPLMLYLATIAAGLVFIAATMAGHIGSVKSFFGNSVIATDYLTAVSFAMFLAVVLQRTQPLKISCYVRLSQLLASFSFSLYIVHLPLLLFLRAALTDAKPLTPNAFAVSLAIAITFIVIAYATLIAYVTEARTNIVRKAALVRLHFSTT